MKMKGRNMKTTATWIAATLGLALFASAAYAQYKATGDDGITASPKLRELITATSGVSSAPIAAAHNCPMCKDQYTSRVDQTAKGALKPTVLVSKHLCPGCETTVTVRGQGKAAQNVATHTCAAGSACCVSQNDCCAEKQACCATAAACCPPKT
jgi:hypothetical protein